MSVAEQPERYPMLEGERINPNQWHIPTAYELDAIRQHYEVPVAAWAATVDISTSMWYAARQGERELGTATLRRARRSSTGGAAAGGSRLSVAVIGASSAGPRPPARRRPRPGDAPAG